MFEPKKSYLSVLKESTTGVPNVGSSIKLQLPPPHPLSKEHGMQLNSQFDTFVQ